MWERYDVKSVLIGVQAFLTIIVFLAWVLFGEPVLLWALGYLVAVALVTKASKWAFFRLAPRQWSHRPPGASDCHALPGSTTASITGMPSGHSLGAFAVAIPLVAWAAHRGADPVHVASGGALVVGLACAVAYSRLVYGCHTPAQVLAGSAIGIGVGTVAAVIGVPALPS